MLCKWRCISTNTLLALVHDRGSVRTHPLSGSWRWTTPWNLRSHLLMAKMKWQHQVWRESRPGTSPPVVGRRRRTAPVLENCSEVVCKVVWPVRDPEEAGKQTWTRTHTQELRAAMLGVDLCTALSNKQNKHPVPLITKQALLVLHGAKGARQQNICDKRSNLDAIGNRWSSSIITEASLGEEVSRMAEGNFWMS